jgi:NAD-dependent dihydropyrimidine dehydrogenase PreA subunit
MNKYIITDNRCYESYLTIGETVYVTERINTGMEELLKTTKARSDGKPLWIRGDMCIKDTHCINESTIERVICIPDSGGHTLDLQRVQYISPLENGGYKVTLVSGWDLPLTDEVYSRQMLIEKWKALQNKSL